MHSAAFSRYSISTVDAFLTCGIGRSNHWTHLAQRQVRGRKVSMSGVNANGKRILHGYGYGNSISWYGMIAFTQGGTLPKNFGSLAIYCADSTNPALCWKRVLADMYGCDWYTILKRIAELAYNITLPSDEKQQARLVKREAVYEEKLSLTRATLAKRDKRNQNKRKVMPALLGVQTVPQDENVSVYVLYYSFSSVLYVLMI